MIHKIDANEAERGEVWMCEDVDESVGDIENVRIAENGAIRWSEDGQLFPDAIYLKLTGKRPEEAIRGFRNATRPWPTWK